MRAILNKKTGLWKWGKDGEYIYTNKADCEKFGMQLLQQSLVEVRNYVNNKQQDAALIGSKQ